MSKHNVNELVVGMSFIIGAPILFFGVVLVSTIMVNTAAAILTTGWIAILQHAIKTVIKNKNKNK